MVDIAKIKKLEKKACQLRGQVYDLKSEINSIESEIENEKLTQCKSPDFFQEFEWMLEVKSTVYKENRYFTYVLTSIDADKILKELHIPPKNFPIGNIKIIIRQDIIVLEPITQTESSQNEFWQEIKKIGLTISCADVYRKFMDKKIELDKAKEIIKNILSLELKGIENDGIVE